MTTNKAIRLGIALALVLATTFALRGVLDLPFIQFDDPEYVTQNASVRNGLSWTGLGWALTAVHAANWHPVTWLSHMADVSVYGMAPTGHHATSLALHCVNVLLLFILLVKMTDAPWRSGLAAALFALHPLRVESVAWVSERKDVLSGFFWLTTTLAYVRWTRLRTWKAQVPVLTLFVLGLASKQMLVTLPFTLLLLDAWPLGRLDLSRPNPREIWSRVREKLPLFGLSAAAALTVYLVQAGAGAAKPVAQYSMLQRVENAGTSILAYLADTVMPTALAVFYPHPELPPSALTIAACFSLLVAVTGAAWWARRRFSFFIVGWLWFLGTLVPVLGFVQVGFQARADRYTYIPSIGLAMIVAWAVPAVKKRSAWLVGLVAATVLGTLAFLTARQVGYWTSDRALFEHALRVTDRNWLAETAIGADKERNGDLAGAAAHYQRALTIRPQAPQALNNLGNLLVGAGSKDQGIALLREAVRQWPGYPAALSNLGSALAESGRLEEGIGYLELAARAVPEDPSMRFNLGLALLQAGRLRDALREFEAVTRLRREIRRRPLWSHESGRNFPGLEGGRYLAPALERGAVSAILVRGESERRSIG